MRIGIIGLGGVGKALLELLVDKKDDLEKEGLSVSVNYIINSKGGVYDSKGIDLRDFNEFLSYDKPIWEYKSGSKDVNFNTIMGNKDIDLLVELTQTDKETGEPGMTHIQESLSKGISVVTANKGPIMLNYKRLREVALINNVQLGIGCTTGGALPSINGGLFDLSGAEVRSIEGVLNGTTNFIIQEMEDKGITYEEALYKAQEQGIAERNPAMDVDGWDTAIKLLILTNVILGTEKKLADISVDGISGIKPIDIVNAKNSGYKLKLVGRTVKIDSGLEMSVGVEKVYNDNPLYIVDGKNKAVKYVSDTLGDLTIIGGASGLTPAAASVLRDIVNIHRGNKLIY